MQQRSGITLVEVLVSLFIMGIGMIALLTLFPLGAVNVAMALRDDRAAQAAGNANAFALARNLRDDTVIVSEFEQELNDVAAAFRSTGPSSPLYVDPFGVQSGAGRLGGLTFPNTPGIRRVSPGYVTNAPIPADSSTQATRAACWFSLLDDLNFDQNGTAAKNARNAIERGGRFTWGYLLRRARADSQAVVEMAVVVYSNRPSTPQAGETTYAATGKIGENTFTINFVNQNLPKPQLRVGSWVLDTTQDVTGVIRGYSYRVVDVQDVGNASVLLELQKPLTAGLNVDPATAPTTFAVVVMENVLEVFDRGTGWRP
jgi:type II secretory pathway pseudopilin PulG